MAAEKNDPRAERINRILQSKESLPLDSEIEETFKEMSILLGLNKSDLVSPLRFDVDTEDLAEELAEADRLMENSSPSKPRQA